MTRPLLAAMLLTGCAMLRIPRTRTTRYPYERYDLAILNGPDAVRDVDAICHKVAAAWSKWNGATAHWDDGKPLDKRNIRACFVWEPRRHPDRKDFRGTVYISLDKLVCLPHELAHADGLNEKQAAEKYPCVGD